MFPTFSRGGDIEIPDRLSAAPYLAKLGGIPQGATPWYPDWKGGGLFTDGVWHINLHIPGWVAWNDLKKILEVALTFADFTRYRGGVRGQWLDFPAIDLNYGTAGHPYWELVAGGLTVGYLGLPEFRGWIKKPFAELKEEDYRNFAAKLEEKFKHDLFSRITNFYLVPFLPSLDVYLAASSGARYTLLKQARQQGIEQHRALSSGGENEVLQDLTDSDLRRMSKYQLGGLLP